MNVLNVSSYWQVAGDRLDHPARRLVRHLPARPVRQDRCSARSPVRTGTRPRRSPPRSSCTDPRRRPFPPSGQPNHRPSEPPNHRTTDAPNARNQGDRQCRHFPRHAARQETRGLVAARCWCVCPNCRCRACLQAAARRSRRKLPPRQPALWFLTCCVTRKVTTLSVSLVRAVRAFGGSWFGGSEGRWFGCPEGGNGRRRGSVQLDRGGLLLGRVPVRTGERAEQPICRTGRAGRCRTRRRAG